MPNDVYSLFVDDLTVLDCAVWHPQRGPIGMSWKVGIDFIGGLDAEGVVFDFSHAKKYAKKVIDDEADHKFICPRRYLDTMLVDDKKYFVFTTEKPYPLAYTCPGSAILGLDDVTESSIISHLENKIHEGLRDTAIISVRLTFVQEKNEESNYYCYTHGLSQHYGACQRLIHGHRSTIKVYVNGERNSILEKNVAEYYYDKHLAYDKNIQKETSRYSKSDGNILISYTGNQGEFSMTIPIDRCIVYPYETTVEYISRYTAEWIRSQFPATKNRTVEVHAFEGIGKGSKYVLGPSEAGLETKTNLMFGE